MGPRPTAGCQVGKLNRAGGRIRGILSCDAVLTFPFDISMDVKCGIPMG